jgi:hypothetical protein
VLANRCGRVDRHRYADFDTSLRELHDRVGADVGHVPGDLVPEDQRILEDRSAGHSLLPVGDVGAADATPLHLDEDLVTVAESVLDLFDPEVTLAMHDDSLHASPPIVARWTSRSSPDPTTAAEVIMPGPRNLS